MGATSSFLYLVFIIISTILGIKYILWPGEESPDHIKRKILRNEGIKL
jgi:hypothetical protein